MQTQYQLGFPLLRHAYAIIDGIPEDRFDLGEISVNVLEDDQANNPHNCNTIACAAGWICLHPDFQAKGLSLSDNGSPRRNGECGDYDIFMSEMFGITYAQSEKLFAPRKDWEDSTDLTDKQVWQRRVKRFLGISV